MFVDWQDISAQLSAWISRRNLALGLVFFLVALLLCALPPQLWILTHTFEISGTEGKVWDSERVITRLKVESQLNALRCTESGAQTLSCSITAPSRRAAKRFRERLSKLRPLGFVTRSDLLDRRDRIMLELVPLKDQVELFTGQLADHQRELSNLPSEAMDLRDQWQALQSDLASLNQQRSLVAEGLAYQEEGQQERRQVFVDKLQQLDEQLSAKQTEVANLRAELEQSLPALLQLHDIQKQLNAVEERRTELLAQANFWKDFLEQHERQELIVDPEDIQVSHKSAQQELQRNPWHVLWSLPLSLMLWGLWLSLGPYLRPNTKAQSEVLSPQDLEKLLSIPYLGEL